MRNVKAVEVSYCEFSFVMVSPVWAVEVSYAVLMHGGVCRGTVRQSR